MAEEEKKTSLIGPLIYLAVVVIIILFVLTNLPFFSNILSGGLGGQSGSTTTLSQNSTGNSSTVISYPSNYDALVAYTLNMINTNRTASGLQNVTLSPIQSGQQHADSMLQNGYFSHWDTQGYKPYMRYTVLGGLGYVEENVAYEATSLPSFQSLSSQENALNELQYSMMYNDSACCNNGHRDNILNPLHNRVSIGVAYDSTHVYFVEDFENYYISLNTPILNGNTTRVTLSGAPSIAMNPGSVLIFYDPTPANLSPSTLNSQYDRAYDQGTFLGGVLPPCNSFLGCCPVFQGYATDYASTWSVNSTSVDIVFSMSKFATQSGVYTIYLTQGSGSSAKYYTSISLFIST